MWLCIQFQWSGIVLVPLVAQILKDLNDKMGDCLFIKINCLLLFMNIVSIECNAVQPEVSWVSNDVFTLESMAIEFLSSSNPIMNPIIIRFPSTQGSHFHIQVSILAFRGGEICNCPANEHTMTFCHITSVRLHARLWWCCYVQLKWYVCKLLLSGDFEYSSNFVCQFEREIKAGIEPTVIVSDLAIPIGNHEDCSENDDTNK